MKNADAQNNTFTSPDTQTNASACKRVVFLQAHRKKLSNLRHEILNNKI